MRKIVVSSALAGMLAIPGTALEIYNVDDTKAEIYGSIRGFMAYGEGTQAGQNAGFLFGIQNNSFFGVRVSSGKFKANVELGVSEPGLGNDGTGAPYRQYWGSYDTGSGVFLFGKTNSPSVDNAFSSNWVNNDSGMLGFGGVATAYRRLQVQYSIAGLSVAVLQDEYNKGKQAEYQQSPRVAASYTINNDKGKPLFKIAGSYKYYNGTESGQIPNSTQDIAGTSAYHVWAGLRPTFGNAFISIIAQYGKNAYLYGEQIAGSYNDGGYGHTSVNRQVGLDAQIAGGKIEFGTKITNDLSFVIGAGYQATFDGSNQQKAVDTNIDNSGPIHSYAAFLQLPYKVSANFEFSPQVAYYNTQGKKDSNLINGKDKQGSAIAGVRFKWDF